MIDPNSPYISPPHIDSDSSNPASLFPRNPSLSIQSENVEIRDAVIALLKPIERIASGTEQIGKMLDNITLLLEHYLE
jgi:hypothetical protein